MASDYWKSTQRKDWKFSIEQLNDMRESLIQSDSKFTDQPVEAWDDNVRIYIFNLVQLLGQRLNTRQRVLSTAHVYLLRIFTRISINEINIYLLVATSVYIACKAEELPQHILTICNESRLLWNELMPPDATHIAECEFYVISELESCLVVFHPYRSLELLSQNMSQFSSVLTLSQEEMQGIWAVINDTYTSDIPLLFSPYIVAVACLYMTLVLRPQLLRPPRPPDRVKARIDLLSTYLGKSAIDLECVAECVQQLVSIYARWEVYDQRKAHAQIVKTLNLE